MDGTRIRRNIKDVSIFNIDTGSKSLVLRYLDTQARLSAPKYRLCGGLYRIPLLVQDADHVKVDEDVRPYDHHHYKYVARLDNLYRLVVCNHTNGVKLWSDRNW